MRFWKFVLATLFMTLSVNALAGIRYECDTNGVPLSDSKGKQISDQRDTHVVYEVKDGHNGNLIIGDLDYIVWEQADSFAIMKRGQETMTLHRVLPRTKKVEFTVDVNYLGRQTTVRCEVR